MNILKKVTVTGVAAALGSAAGAAAGNVGAAVFLGLACVAVIALRERGLTRREEIRRGIVRVGRHQVVRVAGLRVLVLRPAPSPRELPPSGET